jgi:cobalt-precorrin 5A hydrolase
MKLACLYFTAEGENIANRIKLIPKYEVELFSKDNYKSNLESMFKEFEGIVFISSTGIAVRMCAPFIKDKSVDPGIVVIDDLGRYSISLLSGHIGGGNELAKELANYLGCESVITTATDGRGIEAVDVFAKNNNLIIEELRDVKSITARMLKGVKLKLESEVALNIKYDHIVSENEVAAIFVTSKENINYDKPYCILRPRNLVIGIGCKRGKTEQEILGAVKKVLSENNLSIKSVRAISTVDVKQYEEGIIKAAEVLGCELKIFNRAEIEKVQDVFSKSNFVKETIGVSSVCEPCAFLGGGELIVRKTAVNGVTVAVSLDTKTRV